MGGLKKSGVAVVAFVLLIVVWLVVPLPIVVSPIIVGKTVSVIWLEIEYVNHFRYVLVRYVLAFL